MFSSDENTSISGSYLSCIWHDFILTKNSLPALFSSTSIENRKRYLNPPSYFFLLLSELHEET